MSDDDDDNQSRELQRLSQALMARLDRYLQDDPSNYQLMRQAWMHGADSLDLHVELVEMFHGAAYEQRITDYDRELFKEFRITP